MNIAIEKRSSNSVKNILVGLFFGMLSQWASALDYPEKGDFSQGSKTWSENCARCHNMRSPSDLRDDQWVSAVFHMRVRAGLTGQEMRDVLTFLQASNARVEKQQPVKSMARTDNTITAQSGKEIYQTNCVACHGVDGKGTIPGVPDFTDKNGRLLKSNDELLNNIISGFQTPGNSMSMPPRGGNSQLSDDDLNSALQYIKKL
ncbi:MAG: c-type cytochrome [Oleispira sp.]|nr:c-type cytochrome [Oleispira sp.]